MGHAKEVGGSEMPVSKNTNSYIGLNGWKKFIESMKKGEMKTLLNYSTLICDKI